MMEQEQLKLFDLNVNEEEAEGINEVMPLQIGDMVSIKYPTEEENMELYNYLHYNFPYLKGKKGAISEVLPYKKLQYKVVFEIKSDRIEVIMYHDELEWIV